MKKKIFVLSALALLSTISLSGCSFISDIIDNIAGDESSDTDGKGSDQKPSTSIDEWTKKPKGINVDSSVKLYHVDDIFVMPTVSVEFEDGTETVVTKGVTVSDKDDSHYDSSKTIDVDLSKETTESGFKVYVRYACTYNPDPIKTFKYTFSHSYYIRVFKRSDTRFDPIDDLEIKTLQITDVMTNFNKGDNFIKPKVWAIKNDNSKIDVSEAAIFNGFNMNDYGYQNVTISYNNHTLTYEIVVHDRDEEKLYPFFINGFSMRLNLQKALLVIDQKGSLIFKDYQDDGSIVDYGYGCDSFFPDVTFESDNPSVISINDEGVFIAKGVGSAFLYAKLHDTSGEEHVLRTKIDVEEKRPVELNINNYRYNYYSGHDINFAADVTVTYQNGYSEVIIPSVDCSKVDTDTPGKYNVDISYTLNGVTLKQSKEIEILDSSLYVLEKTPMGRNITQYNTNYIASALPTSGTVKNLVVPVKFTDSDTYIKNYDNVCEDIEKSFFGTNEEVGWRSVKTYYEEESHGLVTYTGHVTDIYNVNRPSSDYENGEKMVDLKNAIVDWYFNENPTENRKDYDSNHDGYIDGLNLIYLVPDASTRSDMERKDAPNLWAMVKTQNDKAPNVESPVSCSYLWASYDFIYPTEAIATERVGTHFSNPGQSHGNKNPMGIKLEPRTFIHETGHMFGIDDYYSYTEDVLFAGEINMQTHNYMSHDPYSLLLYNWAEPYIPETSTTITIGDFQKTHDVILLSPSWNTIDSPFDEYFLIDLFVPNSGLNAFDAEQYPGAKAFNTTGIRIWHVDARLATSESLYETFTSDPTGPRASKITDNSFGQVNNEYLEKYDRFMELQLVRNVPDYDYKTSSNVFVEHYFQAGDTFKMSDFVTQFVNGDKMDNGLDLGWEVKIDGIYNSASGYTADITVTKK